MPAAMDLTHELDRLTDRELEVLESLGKGLSDREIGVVLFVSRYTASNHVANLRKTIVAKNRALAAIFAARHQQAIALERGRRNLTVLSHESPKFA